MKHLTQQSNINYDSPARGQPVENPASACVCANQLRPTGGKPDAGTFQKHKDRFASWGECDCSFLEEVHPYGCPDVTIVSCIVCKKENRRFYS